MIDNIQGRRDFFRHGNRVRGQGRGNREVSGRTDRVGSLDADRPAIADDADIERAVIDDEQGPLAVRAQTVEGR